MTTNVDINYQKNNKFISDDILYVYHGKSKKK